MLRVLRLCLEFRVRVRVRVNFTSGTKQEDELEL